MEHEMAGFAEERFPWEVRADLLLASMERQAATPPPYWDTDDEDNRDTDDQDNGDTDDEDDDGPKPAEFYGTYTWKIKNFSHINEKFLCSDTFEIGGHKWHFVVLDYETSAATYLIRIFHEKYLMIFPQGCGVCNHLSVFLAVDDDEKLPPGWSHFAQFSISLVHKDRCRSKYGDSIHRFNEKECDWGWKKFLELPRLLQGFIDYDNLVIKAQVQVLREKVDRPLRCVAGNYRRELLRVYLLNVERVCLSFLEEVRSKLGKLIEDKAWRTSFRDFWSGMDQNSRSSMSSEESDSISKLVVTHFFIEKKVESTLVMHLLYNGLKALENQTVSEKSEVRLSEAEEMPAPIVVRIENDKFVLVDDVLRLLERAASEPLPQNPSKSLNSSEQHNKRLLTEFGRRTLDIFVLSHIFSNKIEVAYEEALALKRQEEVV